MVFQIGIPEKCLQSLKNKLKCEEGFFNKVEG